MVQAMEVTHLEDVDWTLRTSNFWVPRFAFRAIHRVFISWEPLPPPFLKINFDGNVMDSDGRVGFAIRDPNSRLVVVGGNRLFGLFILEVKLRRLSWHRLCETYPLS